MRLFVRKVFHFCINIQSLVDGKLISTKYDRFERKIALITDDISVSLFRILSEFLRFPGAPRGENEGEIEGENDRMSA